MHVETLKYKKSSRSSSYLWEALEQLFDELTTIFATLARRGN